jgi:LysR family nitrogen assimilation transcriptional regulator
MNAVTFPVRVDHGSLRRETPETAFGLRELRSFLSLASTGNLGRTARDLNLSQPAVSLQLRKLEAGFGAQLLWRHGRGVTLTPAGACLRDRLQTVMQLLASPLDDSLNHTQSGRLLLAIPADSGLPLIAPLARAFRQRWPDLTLEVREGNGADLEEWLLHRHVDLAVLQDPPSLPELHATPLLTEALGLVVSAHSMLARHTSPLSMRELAGGSLILPTPSHWIRRRLESAAQQNGVRLNPTVEVTSVALTKAMVRSGLGCAVLPRSAVQDEIDIGALVFRAVGHPPLICTRVLAFHRAASNSLVPAFGDVVREAVVALARGGAWAGANLVRSVGNTPAHGQAPLHVVPQSDEEMAIG